MPFTLFDTGLGACGLGWNDAGVSLVALPEATRTRTRERLADRVDGEELPQTEAPPWVKDAIVRIAEHLSGRPQDLLQVPLDFTDLPPFTAKVYHSLRRVPAGKTVTYGDLANAAGSQGASRAVGRAMATNRWPILVPCHRVVGSNSSAGGFTAYGGLVTKEKILAAEGTSLLPTPSLFASTEGELPYDAQKAVRHLSEVDPVLGKHIAKTGAFTLRLKQTEGTFSALAESIVYQQLSGKAAATIFGRVRDLYPGKRLEPEGVLATKPELLRGAGLSQSKLASLRDLAQRSIDGEIPTLRELARLDDEAIIDRLTHVRGIGRWTVEMLLIFRLGRPDVLPVADYGIKKGFTRTFTRLCRDPDELVAGDVLLRRAERWRPFRSVASWYLWRALDS